jgi:hypothetical protein
LEIYFEYPYYLIIVAVIVAAAISFLLYYKDKLFSDHKPWKKWLMTGLRFLFVFIVLLLLLSPVLKTKGVIVQKPVVVIAQDNSSSILLNKDSLFYNTKYKDQILDLTQKLSEDYDVKYLQFSESTSNDSIIDFSGKLSDISSIFPEIISRFAGMNLGAIILATDGIYNKGINPVYSNNLNVPVYSIALGDTISQKDLILKNLLHNKLAFLGNKFPLRIYISADKCIEKSAELTIVREGKEVYKTMVDIPSMSDVNMIDVELPADKLGIQQYDVKLKHLDNEISYDNNNASFVINVIDNRNKILILGNSPHPDIGAINYAIKDNPDFELTISYLNEFNGSVAAYDLVVLHQLPSVTNNASAVLNEIEKNKIPVLFILGNSTSLKALNNLDKGLQINSLSNNPDDAVPYFNKNFVAFNTGFDEKLFFDNMSALKVIFGEYKILSDVRIFLYQKVNGVKTDNPLILFSEQDGVKTGFITGEGIWRWRIDDYKLNTGHDNFKSLINRIFQYLIVKKMQDKLIVESRQVFNENENVVFTAEFYNEAFELVSNLELQMLITDEDGKEFKYFFGNQGEAYRLDLGRLKSGNYIYKVSTEFDNKEYAEAGKIIVKNINVEALNTKANHIVLEQLAELTGGKVFYPDNMLDIPAAIRKNDSITSIAYEREKLYTITDLFFLFFVILFFAATEWALRKFWGGY